MANKWMIAAVTAVLFSSADWFAATRLADAPHAAAPANNVPATQAAPHVAVSRDREATGAEASRKAHS